MRISKKPQERRAELVAAARLLFDEKGVDKTRVSDIVHKVGVAQGVFYYYFASKDEMVEVVARQIADETDLAAIAILQDEKMDYCKKVAGFIELYLDLIDKFLGDDETRLPPLGSEGDLYGLAAIPMDCYLRHLRTLIEMGAQSGQITAPYPLAVAMVLLRGLRALAEEKMPGRVLVYTVTEHCLGLPKGGLTRYIPD